MYKSLKSIIFSWKELLKAIENETKEQKRGFLGMTLGTLGAIFLENM